MQPNLGGIRYTIVCRRPRKPETTHISQVCYLRKVRSTLFQPIVALKLLGSFLSNLYILVGPYTRPYIPNLKEIATVVSDI